MMPGKSGWEVCKEVRNLSNTPIIFLTALGELSDETHGLDIGADDYIVKPFRYEIFMARVRAAIRRSVKNSSAQYSINEIEVDTISRVVKCNGERVEMSLKEYELFIFLIKNQNIALERDKILDAVWGYDFYGDQRTIDTHIKNIRAKIGTVGNYIKTIRGFGYKFEVEL
jgi:DNA-binding response OmpR family regulator